MSQRKISLKTYTNQIPKCDTLEIAINQMVINEKYSLEDIKEAIDDHISEHTNIHSDDYENFGEASLTAEDMINFIIDWLDTSEASYKRIRDYIDTYHSWDGYNKLLMGDYEKYLFGDERQRLIAKGRKIFVSDITDEWG